MTVPICVDPCDFAVDGDGVLEINKADPTAENPGELTCDDGLKYHHRVPSILRKMISSEINTAGTTLTYNQSRFVGPGNYDDGSALGVWTVEADGSITINVSGVYTLSLWAGIADRAGGGPALGYGVRIFAGAAVLTTSGPRDFSGNDQVDFAANDDGAEDSTAVTRRLTAGSNINWRFTINSVGGGDYFASGDFSMVYHGPDGS